MSLSLFEATVPVIVQFLSALSGLIDKTLIHCESRKIDPAVIFNARLYPDMHPFVRQVQIATDSAKGLAARLAGADIPSFPDTETSFEELKDRLSRTISFVQTFSAPQLEGSEDKTIVLKLSGLEKTFTGRDYALHFAIPNLYFHVTTAYDILRHCGVEIGKKDFFGGL